MMRYPFLIGLLCVGLFLNGVADAQSPGNVVRIRILNDQSDPYADFRGKTSVDAARMAAEDVGGTVLGKSIEIVVGDHQNKPDVASAIARRWFDVDGVSAIAELTSSAVALAVQQIAKEQGKVTLSTGPATTRLTNEDCSPTGFHWAFDTYSQAVGTARAVVAEGGKSWFLLVADYASGHQMASDLNKVVKTNGGTVVGEVRHPLKTSDFSSFNGYEATRRLKADAVLHAIAVIVVTSYALGGDADKAHAEGANHRPGECRWLSDVLRRIPAEDAAQPLSDSKCLLVQEIAAGKPS